MSKKFVVSAICAALLGASAYAADPVVSTTGGLPGYEVIKASDEIAKLPRVKQTLVAPPNVPEHTLEAPATPRVVEVEMFIEEKEIEVEPGVFMWAFTFNGSVPGPLIVVHEGDYVELTLKNLSKNVLVHNIDFHASTGALGGGELTHVAPGEEVKLRWKAIKPGVHIYHCAPGGAMIPWHVVHGMNGAVVVLPKDGLKDKNGNKLTYDKAIYIGEQDFYIPKDENGNYKRYANAAESYADDKKVMDGLIPTHIVFGERKGHYTGDNSPTAKVGETLMIYHSQANRFTYPHLIGGHGEYVWERGNLADVPAQDLETWSIAAGSAGAAMYTFKQPGTYVYLNHNLIEALNLGALATIKVDGKWDNNLMEQLVAPRKFKE
ncbi:copper-containing nitrite reductase [Pelistega ratti]|uniref:copper-containing nitrite reductase n=1 Tax=Pelistega ratti TaxID=2652177 RepID=UPI0013589961|nr:copper-containing nitrite reductase [Pelistega ratti]